MANPPDYDAHSAVKEAKALAKEHNITLMEAFEAMKIDRMVYEHAENKIIYTLLEEIDKGIVLVADNIYGK